MEDDHHEFVNKTKLISIIVLPIAGVLNPVTSLAHEICQSGEFKCIIYGVTEQHRHLIEKSGSEFRRYEHPMLAGLTKQPIQQQQHNIYAYVSKSIDFTRQILPSLLRDVQVDKPDLIIYDQWSLPARYLLEILKTRHHKMKRNPYTTSASNSNKNKPIDRVPLSLIFDPSFAVANNVLKKMPIVKINAWSFVLMFVIFIKQLILNWIYGLSMFTSAKAMLNTYNENLNVFAVYPQLQPNFELFDKRKFKFIGSCIAETVRSGADVIIDDNKFVKSRLTQVLDLVVVKNNEFKLVYVSLGTLFYVNSFIFETIIEAIENFDRFNHDEFNSVEGVNKRCLRACQLKVIYHLFDNI